MPRRVVAIITIACLGATGVVLVPVLTYARMDRAEHAASERLIAIREAQRAFRRAGGAGGYATDLVSLATPCPGEAVRALPADSHTRGDYTVVLRAARQARDVGLDCHGRRTVSDFYAAAAPANAFAGRQAMAMTSWGRIYVFFDGIAPLESDMAAGGLAVPLDTLHDFKIP
jgi:type II secretory pathway pseudopilin PulG